MDAIQIVFASLVGIGLASACGFRVFIPLLAMSIAGQSGAIELSENMSWLGSWPAIVMLSVATAAEIGGYYVPWIDNALDSVATPAALIAGTLATAAIIPGDMGSALQWSIAAIGGGGAAAATQATTVVTRLVSTATTGGLGNPVVSTIETTASTGLSLALILIPVVGITLFLGLTALIIYTFIKRRKNRLATTANPTTQAA
ncbi:DUF4126 domain-containing protein [Poriferisphaera sp. WC338]|uniref:DUF4126 domain-containing protein n=1 Tax=Poriferisphaera sp. WC338 TaxID=3425129 RepID=UPI003D819AD7